MNGVRQLKTGLKRVSQQLPGLGRIVREREALLAAQGKFPIGHYYSPIPTASEVQQRVGRFYEARTVNKVAGVDLNEPGQLATLDALAAYYPEQFLTAPNTPDRRYRNDNPSYGTTDAIVLYGMLRHFRPRRIVEVGCGNSTCVTLDTAERFLDGDLNVTLIEPFPDRLLSLIRSIDHERITLIDLPLQDAPLDVFDALEANDILFIDNSHISRIGSDVNQVFFEILPRLASGIVIHVHDIFYPFDYPRSWLEQGIFYNEAYVLKAFLQYNEQFRILYWNDYLELFRREQLAAAMPACVTSMAGAIWLQKC